jgi:tetratricopeptide (TPR) repeat protein
MSRKKGNPTNNPRSRPRTKHPVQPVRYRDSQDYELEAQKLWRSGKFTKAARLFKEGLSLHPGNPDLLSGLGHSYLGQEEYILAHQAFELAFRLAPDSMEVLLGLGECLINFSRYAEGEALFHRILDRNYEEDPMVGVTIGRALIKNERWVLARENYLKMGSMGYESPEIELGMGICEHHLGQRSFKKHIQKALTMAPRFHEARSYLGNVLFDEGKYEEALECFDRIPLPRHQDPASLKRAMLLTLDLRENFERAFMYAQRLSDLYPHLGTVDEVIQDILREDEQEK